MKLKFWGTRGSIAVPGKDTTVYGGNTTCLELTPESGKKIVIDAGTGIRPLGDILASESDAVDITLLITHVHWDHVWGFPFFDPLYRETTTVKVDGFHTCMKGLRATFDTKMGDGFFPVKFEDLKADIRYLERLKHGSLQVEDVTVDRAPLQHPQGGFGFRFREGPKTLIFMTDNELTDDAWAGRHPEDYVEFCKGADMLIHDAQYTPEERDQRKGWGHSDYAAAIDLAVKSGVGRLVLFHHDPARTDAALTAIVDRCKDLVSERRADLEVMAAREGSELTL
jgi:phosphoribosyl 1,2-cyclic phosphodiesterase